MEPGFVRLGTKYRIYGYVKLLRCWCGNRRKLGIKVWFFQPWWQPIHVRFYLTPWKHPIKVEEFLDATKEK